MATVALSTVVQSWNQRSLSLVAGALLVLHLGSFLVGVAISPTLFHADKFNSSSCHLPKNIDQQGTWYQGYYSPGSNCLPLKPTESTALRQRVISFRFPVLGNELESYSRWNWRLLGSLLLDVTFKGSSHLPTYVEEESGAVESSSPENAKKQSSNSSQFPTPGFTIRELSIPVLLTAFLDTRPLSTHIGPNASESLGGWWREQQIFTERTLQCIVSEPVQEFVATSEMYPTAQYICSLSPFLDIQIPGNKSYIVSVKLDLLNEKSGEEEVEASHAETSPSQKQINDTSSDLDFDSLKPYVEEANESEIIIDKETIELDGFFTKDSEVRGHLTLVVESRDYHKTIFYMKCLFMPFVIAALVWFCLKLYLNDLYISIPDRLLVAAAVAQICQDIPTEALLTHWDAAGIKWYDQVAQMTLVCVLQMFWVVYTQDKLARNEPWERNTRYYWRPLLLLLIFLVTSALFLVFDKGPALNNAFNNHWSSDSTVEISLAFVFLIAILHFIYQTYLTIIIFKSLCLLRRSLYPPVFHRATRLRLILFYCLATSGLTTAGTVLQLAIHLGLHWNPQFVVDPVPTQLALAGPFVLGIQGLWNLHIISLLILLSRESHLDPLREHDARLSGVMKPVRYSESRMQGDASLQSPKEMDSLMEEDATVMQHLEDSSLATAPPGEADSSEEYKQYQQCEPENHEATTGASERQGPTYHYFQHYEHPADASEQASTACTRGQAPILSHHFYPQICIQDVDEGGQHQRICTEQLSWDNDPSTEHSESDSNSYSAYGPESCDLDYDDDQWDDGDEDFESHGAYAVNNRVPLHRRSLNGYQFVQTSYSQSPLPEAEVM